MMHNIENYNKTVFEDIKHIDEKGNEYWEARELQQILGYSKWQNFDITIDRAKEACNNSNINEKDHFTDVSKMVVIGSGAKRKQKDYKLSRYACYLIAQNGDSRKNIIALAQTYFAVQTRKMELTEQEYFKLSEEEKRLYRRKQTKDGNKVLYRVAKEKGVKNFDRFTNAGYKGLYNGETADDIAKRKCLRYREDILDNMGSVELGANIFRITQTEALLERQEKSSEQLATNTHYKVGKAIRNTIKELGGTMPEDLPTPKKSIKELENKKSQKKRLIQ